MKRCFLILAGFMFLAGCAHLTEATKEVWGSSIAHLERARSAGKSSKFALTLDECFEKTQKILTTAGAVVYLKDKEKKYLAAMNFTGHVDTTEVGIFFTKIEDRQTRVEVASMSPGLVDEVAAILFSGLKT